MVKPRENLSLVGSKRTISRVSANDPYPCQMQKTQAFSCLFRHYAKHNGLRKEDLVFSFVDELKPDETPETVHLMPMDEIWVERRCHEPEEEKPEPVSTTSFSDQFRTLLESPVHSDISFIVGEEKHEIPAHKAVLAARSDYFNAMFKPGGMRESKKEVIEITNHSSATFLRLLEFVYTNTVRDLDKIESANLISLLMLSNEYLLEDLRVLCEQTAARCLDMNNITALITLSAKHNAEALRKACLKFVQENNEEIRTNPQIREEIRSNPELALIFFDAHTDSSKDATGSGRKRKRGTSGGGGGGHHPVPSSVQGENPNTILLPPNAEQAL